MTATNEPRRLDAASVADRAMSRWGHLHRPNPDTLDTDDDPELDLAAELATDLAGRRQALWQRAIPSRLLWATLADFDGDAHQVLAEWAHQPAGRNLCLFGPVGVGKSHAAVAAVRQQHHAGLSVRFLPVVELLDLLRPGGPEGTFEALAPWLVLLACALLAVQPLVSRWVARVEHHTAPARLVVGVGVASIYGGYFGAGLGIVLLAALGLTLEEPLQKLNAIKQVLSLTVAVVSAVAVALFGPVSWLSALVVGAGTLVGGRLGVGVARKLPDQVLRSAVIALGVTVAVVLLLRG